MWTGLFEAGLYFDLHRMLELFCGFRSDPGGSDPLPRGLCAASVGQPERSCLFQACRGLGINALESQVYFTRPHFAICWASCGFTT
mgnify:CR=1 FL=1